MPLFWVQLTGHTMNYASDQINQTKKTTAAIATHLEDWELLDDAEDTRGVLLNRSIEGTPSLILRTQNQRLHIGGSCQFKSDAVERTQRLGRWGREAPPNMTVSATRSPAAIAKDIQRRVIKPYLEWYEVKTAELWQEVANVREREAITRRLCDVIGQTPVKEWQGDIESVGFKVSGKQSKVDWFEVGYRNQIDMRLHSLTEAQAQRILELFAAKELI